MRQAIEGQLLYDITYTWTLKYKTRNVSNKRKQTHRYREKAVVTSGERERGRGKIKAGD